MVRTIQTSILVACVLLLTAPARATTPEGACQSGRYAAAASYSACEQKATAKFVASSRLSGDFIKFEIAISKCRVKYTGTWEKLFAKAAGTGATCDAPRFVANGDGTVTDNLTGLEWEKKTDNGTVHDKDNLYTWSVGNDGDGSVFTVFLATLNDNGACFAGHCNWRLPTRAELQTLVVDPYPCLFSQPCISQEFLGPTISNVYWSATTYALSIAAAWGVDFLDGTVGAGDKGVAAYARAVRGGL